jgi:hypothetical protein
MPMWSIEGEATSETHGRSDRPFACEAKGVSASRNVILHSAESSENAFAASKVEIYLSFTVVKRPLLRTTRQRSTSGWSSEVHDPQRVAVVATTRCASAGTATSASAIRKCYRTFC